MNNFQVYTCLYQTISACLFCLQFNNNTSTFDCFSNQLFKLAQTYLTRSLVGRSKLVVPTYPGKPRSTCYVCAPNPVIRIRLNTHTTTVGTLLEAVLKKTLNMVAPDAYTDDARGRSLYELNQYLLVSYSCRSCVLHVYNGLMRECDRCTCDIKR